MKRNLRANVREVFGGIMSESELNIVIEFEDEFHLDVVLDRVLAPLIIEEIKFRLPMQGRAAFLRGEMKITLGIRKGNVKSTKQVQRGNVAYMPLGDSLCIYAEDMKTFSPVNVLGQVASPDSFLDDMKEVRRGSQVTIRSR
ncbi:hypothetical protein EU538_01595 [Candidatus Thorarchaeota archaeon]|nr:MAG: hypothetical protein EU538_01595 [Candidatus Thorarchaeota archaeon]